jgi:thiosulfate dehydrogenase [quinone] large subunit
MNRLAKFAIIFLRVVIGWFFLYQGIVSILDQNWTLSPFIKNTHIFTDFYSILLEPSILPYISYLIKGLFIVVGICMILGIFVRIVSALGILIMLLFYFPLLSFPYVIDAAGTYYLVDSHMIIIAALLFLFAARAGEFFGLGSMFRFSRY